MNILIDVDGVLADFIGAWLDVFNGVTAEWDVAPVLREHVDGMRIHECKEILKRQEEVRERGGEDALEMTGQLVNDFGFCTNIDRYPWAKELVQELRDLGRVRFVTHPLEGHRTWAFERDRWLVRHFGAKLHEVMHVRDKSLVAGSVLIEDNVHNARW
jgi:5'(3')-deoxyribonucleotidase